MINVTTGKHVKHGVRETLCNRRRRKPFNCKCIWGYKPDVNCSCLGHLKIRILRHNIITYHDARGHVRYKRRGPEKFSVLVRGLNGEWVVLLKTSDKNEAYDVLERGLRKMEMAV